MGHAIVYVGTETVFERFGNPKGLLDFHGRIVPGPEDEVILSFRVRSPDRDTTIELVDPSGSTIKQKTFKRVNPAEMIQIKLAKEKLPHPTPSHIELRIKEGGRRA